MNLYILIIATILLVAIILNDPMDPQELARFYAPTKTVWGGSVISAPPLITGPPNHTEAFHQISVPMRNVSGYVDPTDPPPLPGIKIRDANGIAIIEGTPEIALPPGIPSVVYGISLK